MCSMDLMSFRMLPNRVNNLNSKQFRAAKDKMDFKIFKELEDSNQCNNNLCNRISSNSNSSNNNLICKICIRCTIRILNFLNLITNMLPLMLLALLTNILININSKCIRIKCNRINNLEEWWVVIINRIWTNFSNSSKCKVVSINSKISSSKIPCFKVWTWTKWIILSKHKTHFRLNNNLIWTCLNRTNMPTPTLQEISMEV